MKKIFISIIAACATFAINAQAFTIDLVADQNQVNTGGSILLNVNVNGLNDSSAPSLGAYDVNLHFNSSLINVTSINWGDAVKGNQLDLAGFGSLTDSSSPAAGELNLFELSFDDVLDLNSLQAGSFTLFSILFSSTAAGIADFSLSVNVLGDAFGNALTADTISGASVTVGSANVPEPSTLLLLLGGLAIVLLRAKAIVK